MNIYICKVCGHIEFNDVPEKCPVCGAPQTSFEQNDAVFTESRENSPEAEVKHVPQLKVEKECSLIPEDGCTDLMFRIGEVLHPATDEHFIQFADCYIDDTFIERVQFTPKINPAGCFHLKGDKGNIKIVENCNIHGYWYSETGI